MRVDLQVIADMVPAGARVLDIGCHDGELLHHLVTAKGVRGRGIELSREGVALCAQRGLGVIQGDADTDLGDYPDHAFDFAILSQTLPATRNPRDVLGQLVRIGRHAIVSFANFGHWRVRWNLGVHGRMPVTDALPGQWWETANIHLCTITDFVALCRQDRILVEAAHLLDGAGHPRPLVGRFANLLAAQGVFLLRRA
jgi:methionine biosynthesis protein MetW